MNNELTMDTIKNTRTLVNVDAFKNEELKEATRRIYEIGEGVKRYSYEVAHIIYEVNHNESYKQDGFKNVSMWAETMFGFKKSATYNLLKIGENFILKYENENGQVEYTSKFAANGNDFSITQLSRMLPLIADEISVDSFITENEIEYNTSANRISELVKMARGIEEKKSDDKQEEKKPEDKQEEKKPEDKQEEKKSDDKQEEKKSDDKQEENKSEDIEEQFFEIIENDAKTEVTDLVGNKYMIPNKILAKYLVINKKK